MPGYYNRFTYDEYYTQVFGAGGLRDFLYFPQEYFSGADVSIYLGDQFLDEVNSIQFTMIQNVRPIYGHSSYTWDDIAVGQRLVQGSFTINFKEPFYLERKVARAYGLPEPESREMWGSLPDLFTELKNRLPHLFDSDDDRFPYNVMMHIVLRDSPEINSIVDGVKNYYWAPGAQETQDKDYLFKERFNIYIAMGNVQHQNSFDVYYGPGRWISYRGGEDLSRSMALLKMYGPRLMLAEVQITGVSQINDVASEQPVMEQYTFVAKDLVRQSDIVQS